ncbi:MAG: DUF2188 domain-containing protein [bacterium]|nr:DUF2188 domain-containing protein [bacterium]
MAGKLPKFTLEFDEAKDKWALEKDGSGRAVRLFVTKEEATSRGVLRQAVGADGGSVKIQKLNGQYHEERTFPRKADPSQSRG